MIMDRAVYNRGSSQAEDNSTKDNRVKETDVAVRFYGIYEVI